MSAARSAGWGCIAHFILLATMAAVMFILAQETPLAWVFVWPLAFFSVLALLWGIWGLFVGSSPERWQDKVDREGMDDVR